MQRVNRKHRNSAEDLGTRAIFDPNYKATTTYSKQIGRAFLEHYADQFDTCINPVKLSVLDNDLRECIVTPITMFEVLEAMKRLTKAKACDKNGIPSECYKIFAAQIVYLLLTSVNTLLNGSKIPKDFTEAVIRRFLKKDKHPKSVSSISLLNADYKRFAKIMAL
ncbi:hypothetical protein NDU88_004295 [Pleurodeles waltl]|uniref:Uncharacterized protein n=1 Tax=Pleurodeles waltl TaxID=8319 RepID=A0AAV7VJE9_PLEWA|nr:hypothetical protein NDU88_004295 [Pleurodeles waltl]